MRASVFEAIRTGVLPACHVQCFHFPAGTGHQSPDMGADRQDWAVLACELSQGVRDLWCRSGPVQPDLRAVGLAGVPAPGPPIVTKRRRSGSGTTLRRVRGGTGRWCRYRGAGALRRILAGRPIVPVGVTGRGHPDAEPAALMASRTAIWTCSDHSRPHPCVGWGHPQSPSRPRDSASKHAPRDPGTGWSAAAQAPSAPGPTPALPGDGPGRRLRRSRGRR